MFKRVLLITLAIVLLGLAGGYFYLTTDSFREMTRNQAIAWFEGRFRARLEIGELEWRPFSNSIMIRNFAIYDPGSSDEQAAIAGREAIVNFSIIGLLSPRFDLQEVVLEGLVVRIRRETDGRINLARAFDRISPPAPTPPSGIETGIRPFINIGIDRIRASESQILYFDQPISLDSLEGGLAFRLDLLPGARSYRGELTLRGMALGVSGVEYPPNDLEANFQLEDTRIQLDSVRLSGDWMDGRFSGIIDGFQTWDHRVDVDLNVDAAAISRLYALENPVTGRFHLTGTALGRKGDYGLVGRVDGELLQVADHRIADPVGEFRLDMQGIELSRVSGTYQSVPFQGAGQLWWRGDQISTFSGSSTSLLRHPLVTLLRPYAELNSRSQVRGVVNFPGLRFSEWSASGDLDLPGTLTPNGEPPLAPQFRTRARWAGDGSSGFQVSNCQIELDQTLVDCRGSFQNTEQFQLEFSFESHASSQVVAWGQRWLPLDGAQASGRISGAGTLQSRPGSSPALQVHSALAGLAFRGLPLGEAEIDLQNNPDASWNVALRLDEQGLASGTVEVLLDDGEMPLRTAGGRLTGQLGVLLDQALGLEGSRAPATFEFSIERDEQGKLKGPLQLNGSGWRVASQSLAGIQVEADFIESRLELHNLALNLPEMGIVQAQGQIDLYERRFDLDFSARNINLARITVFETALPVAGVVNFEGSASGTTRWPPAFSVRATTPALIFGERSFGPLSVSAEHLPGAPDAQVAGELNFQGQGFNFEGSVGLLDPFRFQVSSRLQGLSPAFVLALTPLAERSDLPPIGGTLDGHVTLAGNLSEPKLETARLELDEVRLSSGDIELRNQGPLLIDLTADRITMNEITFVGPGSTITFQGNVNLTEDDPALNIRARGTAGLNLLNPFLEGGNTRGQADIQLVLGGTLSEPRLVGEVSIEDASIQHPSLPERLTSIRSRLRFTANQLAIEEFQANTTYGLVEIEGGIFLDGLKPSRWLLHITGQDLRVEFPADLVSIVDVELDLVRVDGIPLLSGIVHLRSADYTEDISVSDLMLSYGRFTPTTSSSTAIELGLNITVNAHRAIRIDNNLAEIAASGDLKIRGTLSNPILLGNLTVDEGRLFLERNEYRIVRGGVNFNDPRRTRGVLSFEAETQVQDFDINIVVNGPLDRLNVNFRADPPLPTPNIVSLLALGQTGEDLFQGGTDQRAGSLAVYGAGALLNQSLNERLQRQSNRLFGLDRISIDPFLSSAERDPGARVTLAKSIGNRLSVTYSTDLGSESQGQIVVIQWRLTDWLTVVGTGEQNGTLAIDFKLRRRF